MNTENTVKMKLSEMEDTARRIETLANMLEIITESGSLNEDIAEDSARMIYDLAGNLRRMIDEAQAAAADCPA